MRSGDVPSMNVSDTDFNDTAQNIDVRVEYVNGGNHFTFNVSFKREAEKNRLHIFGCRCIGTLNIQCAHVIKLHLRLLLCSRITNIPPVMKPVH